MSNLHKVNAEWKGAMYQLVCKLYLQYGQLFRYLKMDLPKICSTDFSLT